jgi:hypothetical protein
LAGTAFGCWRVFRGKIRRRKSRVTESASAQLDSAILSGSSSPAHGERRPAPAHQTFSRRPGSVLCRQRRVLLDGKTCQACAVKTKYSRAKKSGRQVLALPLYEFIQQQRQQEEGFEKRYRKRVGIEGTFSQAV